jgi:hypothetical protein
VMAVAIATAMKKAARALRVMKLVGRASHVTA